MPRGRRQSPESKHPRCWLSLLWAVYALVYDVLLVLKPYTDTLRRVCEVLEEARSQSVLDAGCGTGNLGLYAANHKVGSILGIDSSRVMLALAKFKKRLLRERMELSHFSWADLNLPATLPEERFDAIVSIGALHAVHDPQSAAHHLVRRLSPGGTLVLVLPRPVSMAGIIREHLRTAGRWRLVLSFISLPLFALSMIINLIEESWAKREEVHFLSEGDARKLVEQTGVRVRECALIFGNAYTLVVGDKPANDNAA